MNDTVDAIVNVIRSIYDDAIISGPDCLTIFGSPDIWLPKKKIAIIVTPIDWYTTDQIKQNPISLQRPIKQFAAIGIKLIIISEALWIEKQSIIVNKLYVHFGKAITIGARKMTLRKIDKATSDSFFAINHLLGPSADQTINVGLCHGDKLMMVASWGERYRLANCSWELIRLASISNTIIMGGISRVLAWFKLVYEKPFTTLTDLSWGTPASSWEKFGLVLSHMSGPSISFIKTNSNETNNCVFSKSGSVNTIEVMVSTGFTPILDYGYNVFVSANNGDV